MKKNLTRSLAAAGLLFSLSAAAQEQKPGLPGMYPASIDFKTNPKALEKGAVVLVDANGKSSKGNDAVLTRTDKDNAGQTHFRYNQTHLGIPVEHATYIVHAKNDAIVFENGKWVKDFPADLKATPILTKQTALSMATAEIGAATYKWQVPAEEAFIKAETNDANATFYPRGNLVFYSGEEEVIPAAMRLAYKFDIYAAYPVSRTIVFVDANNGSVLGKREMIHSTNSPGTATTAYSGTQSITTDYTGSTYRLRETGRGNGIQTFNMKNAGTNYGAAVDFTDADNNWNNVNTNKDQYATDAHWGAEKTYDYYYIKHGRSSVDNAGLILKSYVHVNLVAQGYPDNINAFWDGTRMSYGDGGSGYNPLTALDIAGHEISHGVTEYSSNLTYSGESGAMNEGFSDIFGTSIEFYGRPSRANWLIGEDIGAAFRSMSSPNAYSQPDTYKGTYWYSGTADNGGVHTNSGVLNYWYYLLSQGGSGTNDKGTAFNVTGLGIDKAGKIAYRLNAYYLVSTSNYAAARTYGIKSAEDLFGVGSAEAAQTANAFTAVGIGGTVTPPGCSDNYESNESISAAKSITKNVDITAKISSSNDKDWFYFTTTSSAPKVQITLTNLPGDYDVRLYNSSGTQIGISQNGGTTSETIKYNSSSSAGTYYVQVYGYNGVNSTSCYTLRASTSGVNFIGDDGNQIISKKADNPVEFSVFPSPAGSGSTINLQFSSAESIAKNIVITDLTGRNVFSKSASVNEGVNNLQLQLPRLSPGTYLIRIDGKNVRKISIQ